MTKLSDFGTPFYIRDQDVSVPYYMFSVFHSPPQPTTAGRLSLVIVYMIRDNQCMTTFPQVEWNPRPLRYYPRQYTGS